MQRRARRPSASRKAGSRIDRPAAKIRAELARVTKELYGRGLVTAGGGNLSARDPHAPDHVWITPAGEFKGGLRAASMVGIDLEGKPLFKTSASPSSDYRFHCAIYRARPDVHAIVHTHAPQAFRLALTGRRFLPISTEAALVGEIPIVPFLQPGTAELAGAVASAIGEGTAVMMQNHGLVVAAETLQRAMEMTEMVEMTAGALLACRMMGVEPVVLSPGEVEKVREKESRGG